jgi:hypothetical protein
MHTMPLKTECCGVRNLLLIALVGVATVSLAAAEDGRLAKAEASPHGVVMRINYHGWPDALLLRNDVVETIIVPAIGRVMQFRFAGAQDGPFWENDQLLGAKPDANSTEWANLGGDKAWPSPQASWPQIISRGWPPPRGFDGLPHEALIEGTAVVLVSPVDPDFGIRVRRQIELQPDRPVMTITTRYEKISGPPVETGVWVITQVKDPVAIYVLLPAAAHSAAGYVRQSDELPANFKLENGLIALTRDPKKNHKIGTLAGSLVWVGHTELLRIDSALVPGGKYPDDGSSAEIYTNLDPLAYVELELLGPLTRMAVGDKIERLSTYTLEHRTQNDPAAEVRKLLQR